MYEEYIDYCCDDIEKKKQEILSNILREFFDGESYFASDIGKFHVFSHGKQNLSFDQSIEIDIINESGIPPIRPRAIERSKINYNEYIYPKFETLTFETHEGGQYEIAVRMWSDSTWKGYKINDWNEKSYLIGVNTEGR